MQSIERMEKEMENTMVKYGNEMDELTVDEQKLVGEYMDKTDAWVRKENGEWLIEDFSDTVFYDSKDEMLEAVRYNLCEIEKAAHTIESVEPEYTGGNIYIFVGKLTNGNYFVADGDMFDVRIVDAPWDWEESQFPDWQESHLVEDLSAADALQFCKRMLEWVKTNEPDGNYSMSDMDYIEKDLDDCIKDEQNGVMWR